MSFLINCLIIFAYKRICTVQKPLNQMDQVQSSSADQVPNADEKEAKKDEWPVSRKITDDDGM